MIRISRRQALIYLGTIAMAEPSARGFSAFQAPHPPLWTVERGRGKVYIFGFGESADRTWMTPAILKAFDESQEIWFEVPQQNPSAPKTARSGTALSSGAAERSLFDVLGPVLSERVFAAAKRYGVSADQLEHTRPWRAYFVLNGAYLARNGARLPKVENFPDVVLAQMAYERKMVVRSEFATGEDAMAHFVNMPEAEAIERLEFLLNYFDEDEAGQLTDRYDWIFGETSTKTIDRMRTRWPLLYQDEQVSRNVGWANRIAGSLEKGGTYFVAIGLQHTLGADSLLKKLDAIGLHATRV